MSGGGKSSPFSLAKARAFALKQTEINDRVLETLRQQAQLIDALRSRIEDLERRLAAPGGA